MSLFSHAARIPHHEPGYNEVDFVDAFSKETLQHAGDERQLILDYVANCLQGCERPQILDIGCGPGWIPIRLAQSNPELRVTGIDVSLQFLANANENKNREGVGEQVEFVEGSAEGLDQFAAQSFDMVISNQSLHYWTSPHNVFDQVARLLKPNGNFCISDDRRDMTLFGRLQVVLGRLMLSNQIGTSWQRSVDGCFSSDEITQMLRESELRDRWAMSLRPRGMLITSR